MKKKLIKTPSGNQTLKMIKEKDSMKPVSKNASEGSKNGIGMNKAQTNPPIKPQNTSGIAKIPKKDGMAAYPTGKSEKGLSSTSSIPSREKEGSVTKIPSPQGLDMTNKYTTGYRNASEYEKSSSMRPGNADAVIQLGGVKGNYGNSILANKGLESLGKVMYTTGYTEANEYENKNMKNMPK